MPDRTPLSDDAVDNALASLDGWRREGTSIVRQLEFGDFREAFAFLTRVAFEAEAANHHPEISNVYNRVRLVLRTHDADNRVTETDLVLARTINDI